MCERKRLKNLTIFEDYNMKMNTDNYVYKLSPFHELVAKLFFLKKVAKQLKSTKRIYK